MGVRSTCSVCGGVFPPLQKTQGWGSLGKVRPRDGRRPWFPPFAQDAKGGAASVQFIGSMKIPTQRKPPFDKLRAGRCVGHPARWIPSWGKEEVALPPLKPTEGLSGPPSKTTFP